MRLSIVLDEVRQVGQGLEKEPARARCCDVVHELRIVPVGHKDHRLAALDQRPVEPLIVGKDVGAVPVGMEHGTRGPHDVVVRIHHRGLALGEGIIVRLHPGRVALSDLAEPFRVQPASGQQHLPAKDGDQAGKEGHIGPGHAHQVGVRLAVGVIVVVESTDQLCFVRFPIRFPGIEAQDVLGAVKGTADVVVIVDAPRRVPGVAHAGALGVQFPVADQRGEQDVIVPGAHKRPARLRLARGRAVHADVDAGYGSDQGPVSLRVELDAGHAGWHL